MKYFIAMFVIRGLLLKLLSERMCSTCIWTLTPNRNGNAKLVNRNVEMLPTTHIKVYHGAGTASIDLVDGLLRNIISTPKAVRNTGPFCRHRSSNTPLTEREEIFRAAQESWQTVSLHHMVRSHLNHCPECHLRCARPQYVRRHMQRKHPALADVIHTVEQQVRDSNIGLQSPCRFCGQAYKVQRQHLSSCAGIFAGHYVHFDSGTWPRRRASPPTPSWIRPHRSYNSSNP